MRRRILTSKIDGNWILPDGSNAKTCDVVFANKNDGKLTIVEGDKWSTTTHPKNTWEPIGIVVIPGEHGVFKDGSGTVNQCGVMSIVPMSYSTPEKGGSSEQGMYWGDYGTDITGNSDGLGRYDSYNGNGLINYSQVVVVNKSNPTVPTTKNSATEIPMQTSVGGTPEWYRSISGAPSPYSGDDYKSGGLNPAYTAVTSPSSSANCLSDFRGIVNTKIITELATGQSGWKTASKITNNSGATYYPAACCCARFKTTGTKAFVDCSTDELKEGKGFWYMPSIGELGYIMPRLYDINQTISKLKSAYGVGVGLGTYNHYWSSTEYNGYYARNVNISYGSVGFSNKGTIDSDVRAFLHL